MVKFRIYGFALMATTFAAKAQDLSQATKAIDAEQYEKAKTLLKQSFSANPANGKSAFLLGNIYLKQEVVDSAKIYFEKGLAAPNAGKLNSIGLAQIDLNADNVAAAQAKFDAVVKDLKKKDTEEYVFIARALMNADKPDYKKAITYLTKAKEINPSDTQVLLALGDAYYGERDQNNAYSAYRSAFYIDNTLIRAKMQMGVLLKGAKAYNEAMNAFNEVIGLNANYGPVYREMAETYYLWASNQPKTYDENIAKALSSYTKYMELTDYSLASRMRHADFLVLAKDYKALEVEANEMKKLDKVNPRVLRYLGYASYENGNVDGAISALNEYFVKGKKFIGYDYYYLGLAKIKKAIGADGKTVDATLLNSGIAELKKAVETQPSIASSFNELGVGYFKQKLYNVSSPILETALLSSENKNVFEDNMYYAISVFSENRLKDLKDMDKVAMDKADKAFDRVIVERPEYPDSYLYKARLNSSLEKDDVMAVNYQKFLDITLAKPADVVEKNKAKIIEAYNSLGAHFANSDKTKAKEFFGKTIALDATNKYALESLEKLKK